MRRPLRRTPRFVRVLGQRVGIRLIKDLTHEDAGSEPTPAYGVFDPAVPIIWLDRPSGSERRKVTLVHECLHAMLSVAHIYGVDNEEELVGRLSPILLDFIRANRSTIMYLQES